MSYMLGLVRATRDSAATVIGTTQTLLVTRLGVATLRTRASCSLFDDVALVNCVGVVLFCKALVTMSVERGGDG